jgi:hypothetical protein
MSSFQSPIRCGLFGFLFCLSFAASAFNGVERGGTPYVLALECQTEASDLCQTTLEVGAQVGNPFQVFGTRQCAGQKMTKFLSTVQTLPADFTKTPATPLIFRGSNLQVSATLPEVPDFAKPHFYTMAGRLDLIVRGKRVSQKLICQGHIIEQNVIMPAFHRERIQSLRLIKNGPDVLFQSSLEIQYLKSCGDIDIRPKLSPVLINNEVTCDPSGTCHGSTGDIIGINVEVLTRSSVACQAADSLETLTVPLVDVMAFHDLPANGIDGLKLLALQPEL